MTSLLHAIKIRASVKGVAPIRQHAEAISIEEIQTLMQWSKRTCLNELLEMPILNVETLMFCLSMLLGEHLWPQHSLCGQGGAHRDTKQILSCPVYVRCFELLTLEKQDIVEDCTGPQPYCIPHFKVKLENRKGWEHEQGFDGHQMSTHLPFPISCDLT